MLKKITILFAAICIVSQLSAQVRLPEKPTTYEHKEYQLNETGFWCAAEAGISTSLIIDGPNAQRTDISIIGGYRFNDFFRIGLGVGCNYYFNNNFALRGNHSAVTVPVFANFRGNFMSQRVREIVPFWSVNLGANVGDGMFVSPTIGARFGELRNAWLVGLNYTLADVKVYPKAVSFIGIKLGYEF